MPVLYFDVDLRTQLSAPQFTRTNQRYRGVRESWKIDLELKQTYFSITRLYERYEALKEQADYNVLYLTQGGVTDMGADPDLVTPGLDELITRVANLNARVKRLER